MNLLYNFLIVLASPLWVPWMVWRARRRKEGIDWGQRTGNYAFALGRSTRRVWLHAVSVGEVMAALPILREIRAISPDVEVVLSVTTSSGHRTATEKAAGLYDQLVYFPIDVPRFVLGALIRVKPNVLVVMETELWMNFFQMAKNFGVPVLVVNGRVSDRSFPRAQKVRFFYKALLANVSQCLMQSETDAARIRALGASEDVVEVLGNCKFDEAAGVGSADSRGWRVELRIGEAEKVVVVGSTRGAGEEALVLDALQASEGSWDRVVWAPRHLERADDLASEVVRRFGEVARRSAKETGRILVLDTYGELAEVYSVADVVVVGGGFEDLGGQNILQPLAHGKPVLHGPHMQNFRDVSEMAGRAGASVVAGSAEELGSVLGRLLGDGEERGRMGGAARELVASQVGASRRYAERIVGAMVDCWPEPRKRG